MKWFRDLSIRYKLILMIVLVSSVSLTVAGSAFLLYDIGDYKRETIAETRTLAAIMATNTTAALAFHDPEAAEQTLSALAKEKDILRASVLLSDGSVFAEYRRPRLGEQAGPVRLQHPGYRIIDGRLALLEPIHLEDEPLAMIYMETDLHKLNARIVRYVSLGGSVAALAMIVVFLLSSRLQRVVSLPILSLAAIARRISREKDYSLRAMKEADDEVGILIDGFNEMLGEIQKKDAELKSHREQLETEVADRTAALTKVNRRLKDSEARLRAIVEGTSTSTGVEFLDALVTTLSRALGTRWVSVGMLRPGGAIEVLAMWDGKQIVRNMRYELRGMPCAKALESSFVLFDDQVLRQFPDVALLRELGVRGYVGVGLRDRDNKPIGVLCAFHDGPLPDAAREEPMLRVFASRAAVELERIRTEAELSKSESWTRAVLDSAADGIITVNERGLIETFNHAAEQIFGYKAEETLGRNVSMLMPSPHREQHDDYIKRYVRSGLARVVGTSREVEALRKDGTLFPMNLALSAVSLEDEVSVTAIVRDVSRERELERMKSDFVSSVSHEVRTPLSAIVSSAKILLKHGERRRGVTAKFSTIIVEEGKRLTRLINDLLDLSKMDAGKIEWTMREKAVDELVDHVVALGEAEAREKGLEISTFVASGLRPVYVDSDKIVQVLTNLLNNSIKFTERGGRVEIRAEQWDRAFVCISVRDSGVGIAQADQPRIFERFKQVGDVLTDRPRGTGLGLPICKEIVERLGGRIWVESDPDQGSTFRFTVPVASSHYLGSHDGEEPPRGAAGACAPVGS